MAFTLPHFDLDAFVRATLAEDLGPTGTDVTSQSVIPADVRFEGTMDSRDVSENPWKRHAAAVRPAAPSTSGAAASVAFIVMRR